MKARATSSATSASSSARRTSRSAASTSASVSAPRRVRRSRMRPSRSESESNIVPSSCDLVLRSVRSTRLEGRGPHAASSFETRPSGAPQDEVRNTYGARGRIALSGGGLRPRAGRLVLVSALGESARNLWMGLGEVKDGWPAPLLRVLRVLSLCPATRSVDSPPACGEGLGVWVAVAGPNRVHQLRPPPRRFAPTLATRGRVKTEFAARGDRTSPGYTSIHTHTFSFPRRVFCARVLLLASRTRNEGWRSAEITCGCCGTRGARLAARPGRV